jgi:hypothetical protein
MRAAATPTPTLTWKPIHGGFRGTSGDSLREYHLRRDHIAPATLRPPTPRRRGPRVRGVFAVIAWVNPLTLVAAGRRLGLGTWVRPTTWAITCGHGARG